MKNFPRFAKVLLDGPNFAAPPANTFADVAKVTVTYPRMPAAHRRTSGLGCKPSAPQIPPQSGIPAQKINLSDSALVVLSDLQRTKSRPAKASSLGEETLGAIEQIWIFSHVRATRASRPKKVCVVLVNDHRGVSASRT